MSDKTENATKEPGRVAQVRQAYAAIKQLDPKLGWWMAAAALAAFLLIVGIGAALSGGFSGLWFWYSFIVAIPAAALAAVVVMNRRGNTAMYSALEGQPGAVGATLQGMGKRGWYAGLEPVAIEGARGTRQQDLADAAMVFRVLGRPGIVLIGEGPAARVGRMLKAEEKKVSRVAPGVPVHLWTVGNDEGQVPIKKVSSKLTRMKPVLSKEEASVVNKRLRSLGGLKPAIPKGMDPTRARMDRKALRGK